MLIWCMFILYVLLCIYLFARLIHWLKTVMFLFRHKRTQAIILVFYILLAFTVIIGGLLPTTSSCKRFFIHFGNYWLGTFILLLTFILVSDFCNLIFKKIHKKNPIPFMDQIYRYYFTGIIIFLLSSGFSLYGNIHAKELKVRDIEITIDKQVNSPKELRAVLVADLHLGYNFDCSQTQTLVDTINKQHPDVVLIAGDIFDNDYDALDNPEKLISILQSIQSKYGTYAVYGNHDVTETLVGGFSIASRSLAFRDSRMEEFLEQCNITVLEDEVTTIVNNSIYLIGRLDAEKAGDGTSDRMSIKKLTQTLDQSKPILLLDHEPRNLQSIASCGVDIMFSGHTHGGQFFPLTVVQPFAWENYYGIQKVQQMYSIVTYGVGVYGPNMRTFTDSEIMNITIKFY